MGASENSEGGRCYIKISSRINRRRTSEVKVVGDGLVALPTSRYCPNCRQHNRREGMMTRKWINQKELLVHRAKEINNKKLPSLG